VAARGAVDNGAGTTPAHRCASLPTAGGAPDHRSVIGAVLARRLHGMMFGSGETIAGAIYGTVVVMATLVAGGANEGIGAWELAVAVAVTTIVLGLAHLYAEMVAGGIERHRRLTAAERRRVWRRELAIPLAAALPVAVLVLGAAGAVDEGAAVWIAILIGLVTLAVQGVRYARVERLSTLGTVASVAMNLALGLAMVALKVAISH
jgi:hypothetical protein